MTHGTRPTGLEVAVFELCFASRASSLLGVRYIGAANQAQRPKAQTGTELRNSLSHCARFIDKTRRILARVMCNDAKTMRHAASAVAGCWVGQLRPHTPPFLFLPFWFLMADLMGPFSFTRTGFGVARFYPPLELCTRTRTRTTKCGMPYGGQRTKAPPWLVRGAWAGTGAPRRIFGL